MKTVSEKVWLAAVGLIVLYSVYPNGVVLAENVVIDGLDPSTPLSGHGVTPVVTGKRLDIGIPGKTSLSVASWPAFLPQQFAQQKVEASRLLRPSGPADRIVFTRMEDVRPWLMVGTGAIPSTELVEGWRLKFDGDNWSLSNGKEEKRLRTANKPARPTLVAHGQERWCVYLLSYEVPATQAGIASEGETRATWAAVRLSSGKGQCADLD
jgi:hypothetical protein